jgi:hypothetical protein
MSRDDQESNAENDGSGNSLHTSSNQTGRLMKIGAYFEDMRFMAIGGVPLHLSSPVARLSRSKTAGIGC